MPIPPLPAPVPGDRSAPVSRAPIRPVGPLDPVRRGGLARESGWSVGPAVVQCPGVKPDEWSSGGGFGTIPGIHADPSETERC